MKTMIRSGSAAALLLALLACSLGLLAPACGGSGRSAADFEREPAAGRKRITGTVLDFDTGAVVQGAEISAPDGSKTKSDAAGRFSIELPAEAAGPLTARADDGRSASLPLRPAREGDARRREVVFHVAR